jgi:hypothetical protein
MLALDLGILNKKAHKIPVKEALMWSSVWITLAMLFFIFIFFEFGKTRALEFLTGYVIEYSLSVDNIFVFILVFSYFAVLGDNWSPGDEGIVYFCRGGSYSQISLDCYYFRRLPGFYRLKNVTAEADQDLPGKESSYEGIPEAYAGF